MAKGSAMGLWRGKKGSSVFYRIANSNNKEVQGIREYNPAPANPQSNAQASQRLKMQAAQRIFGALGSIIRRSWQGVKYGQKSYQKFLTLALSMEDGYPYEVKDDYRAAPGQYQISSGTLLPVETEYDDIDRHFTSLVAGTQEGQTSFEGVITSDTSVQMISSELIAGNSQLQEGDQLTFVACVCSASTFGAADLLEGRYLWYYGSFVLDSSATAGRFGSLSVINDVFQLHGIQDGLGVLRLAIEPVSSDNTIVASAVIVSRLQDSSTNVYMRSPSTLFVPDAVIGAWTSTEQILLSRRSYQRKAQSAAADSNWPVEPGEGVVDEGAMYTVTVNVTPSGSGTVTGAGTYPAGTVVTLRDATEEGSWSLDEWQIDGETVKVGGEYYTFTVLRDVTVTVLFSEEERP